MMQRVALPPEGEYLLARRIICGNIDESPAYFSCTNARGIEIQPFDRERAASTYISETLLVLRRTEGIPARLRGSELIEYIEKHRLWYDNASRTLRVGEASEETVKPILYIMPRISSSDFTP